MKITTDQIKRSCLYKTTACLMLGAVLAVSVAGSAQAAPFHRGPDRGWDHHAAWAHRDWHRGPPPRAVYAPPVVYAPPPVAESPGLSLVIPMNFR